MKICIWIISAVFLWLGPADRLSAAEGTCESPRGVGPDSAGKVLIAHWTFDEDSGGSPACAERALTWGQARADRAATTMCPYRGAQEVREIPDPVFQGVEWLSIRPKIKNAPTIVRPGPVD